MNCVIQVTFSNVDRSQINAPFGIYIYLSLPLLLPQPSAIPGSPVDVNTPTFCGSYFAFSGWNKAMVKQADALVSKTGCLVPLTCQKMYMCDVARSGNGPPFAMPRSANIADH